MNTSDRPLLAYISAASHSGSTLLAMLLNAHPDVCTAGELKLGGLSNIEQYRCSCRKLILQCEFWEAVASGMRNRGEDFKLDAAGTDLSSIPGPYVARLLKPLLRGGPAELARDALLSLSPAWRGQFPTWKRRNKALIEEVARVSGCPVIVDSSKTGLRLKYLHKVDGLQVKLIRLVRDGRAVALTYMDATNYADATNPELRGGGSGKRNYRDLSMEQAAKEWLRSNEEAECLATLLGDENVIRVRYEDLCTDTGGTLDQIVRFLELNPDYDYRQFRAASHHVVGNGMRLDDTSEIRLDDRWRDVLTDKDLAVFQDIAGPMNQHYGYDS